MKTRLPCFAAIALLMTPGAASAKDKTTWLCKPGQKHNPCRVDLTATVQKSDGSSTVERRSNAKKPAIDCFFVYPTVSDQKTINATLAKDPEIKAFAQRTLPTLQHHLALARDLQATLSQ